MVAVNMTRESDAVTRALGRRPGKVFAVHLNYQSRVEEFGTRLVVGPLSGNTDTVRQMRAERKIGLPDQDEVLDAETSQQRD